MNVNHADAKKGKGRPGRPRLAPKPEALEADPGERRREVMTLREAAEYLHCHPSTIYRMANHGDIPGFRLGGGWRFRRSDIEKWIVSRIAKPPESKLAPRKGRPRRRKDKPES